MATSNEIPSFKHARTQTLHKQTFQGDALVSQHMKKHIFKKQNTEATAEKQIAHQLT